MRPWRSVSTGAMNGALTDFHVPARCFNGNYIAGGALMRPWCGVTTGAMNGTPTTHYITGRAFMRSRMSHYNLVPPDVKEFRYLDIR